MMHRFPLPTDAELEKLIMQAYEDMPNPDQSRLSLIESRLLQKARKNKHQKNLNKIPWWFVLLLIGGVATAAWWTGETFFTENKTENTIKDLKSILPVEEETTIMNKQATDIINQEDHEINENDNSPVIYQREVF